MSGSVAEERIRAKAEVALRTVWPSGRIIHELMLQQGGCRIDLACVTPDRLIVVEIKSERDVLTRLRRQREEAKDVADGFCAAIAEKHWRKAWEEGHVCITDAAKEDEIEQSLLRGRRTVLEGLCNAPARLQMLWAGELRAVAGTTPKTPRMTSIRHASDSMTGAEIRRRVCDALRARVFPRADAPILSDLFPAASHESISPYRAAA